MFEHIEGFEGYHTIPGRPPPCRPLFSCTGGTKTGACPSPAGFGTRSEATSGFGSGAMSKRLPNRGGWACRDGGNADGRKADKRGQEKGGESAAFHTPPDVSIVGFVSRTKSTLRLPTQAENKSLAIREPRYIPLQQRFFHLVQGEGEVGLELLEAGGDVPALLAPVYARHEEVDEPGQAVLVHGLYVGQVRDAEEEDLAGVGDRRVSPPNLLGGDEEWTEGF